MAWIGRDYAGLLVKRAGNGDRDTAIVVIDESLGIAQELGMTPLEAPLAALLEIAESLPTSVSAYPLMSCLQF